MRRREKISIALASILSAITLSSYVHAATIVQEIPDLVGSYTPADIYETNPEDLYNTNIPGSPFPVFRVSNFVVDDWNDDVGKFVFEFTGTYLSPTLRALDGTNIVMPLNMNWGVSEFASAGHFLDENINFDSDDLKITISSNGKDFSGQYTFNFPPPYYRFGGDVQSFAVEAYMVFYLPFGSSEPGGDFTIVDRGSVSINSARATFFGTRLAAVPEPDTWSMLIMGFALIGAGYRAQRSRRNFATERKASKEVCVGGSSA
jgi:PEP-CTERM motif